jgi:hypothetical protein
MSSLSTIQRSNEAGEIQTSVPETFGLTARFVKQMETFFIDRRWWR